MKIMEIRKTLENEYKRLLIELELFSASGSTGDHSISPFNKKTEVAVEVGELEQKLVKIRRIKQQVADYKHALEKIENGTYGLCDNCGRSIAKERLQAIPQANLCLVCKTSEHRTLLNSYAR
jgi:DnaK suppressor protein